MQSLIGNLFEENQSERSTLSPDLCQSSILCSTDSSLNNGRPEASPKSYVQTLSPDITESAEFTPLDLSQPNKLPSSNLEVKKPAFSIQNLLEPESSDNILNTVNQFNKKMFQNTANNLQSTFNETILQNNVNFSKYISSLLLLKKLQNDNVSNILQNMIGTHESTNDSKEYSMEDNFSSLQPMNDSITSQQSNSKESESGKEPIILYDPEPKNARELTRAMIISKDPRIKFVNDGMAIKNPFAVDRKYQIATLMDSFCVKLENGKYICKGCNRVTDKLRSMQQHLLSHSGSKFNLCVKCLKGFNDKYDMKRHTRKHTFVKPFKCLECSRSFSQRCSLEGHRKKIHNIVFDYALNQRREVVRVCEKCGFSCRTIDILLSHLQEFHPSDSNIPKLIKQLSKRKSFFLKRPNTINSSAESTDESMNVYNLSLSHNELD